MEKEIIKKNSGFTLVESLFAVLILTFTITGLMTIVANSLFSARYSKDEIITNYLLQEVVDYVRNDRDATVFLGGTWDEFKSHYDSCISTSTNQNPDGCYFSVLENINNKGATIKSCKSAYDDTYADFGIGVSCSSMNFYYDENATFGSYYTYNPYGKFENNNGNNLKTSYKRKIIIEEKSLDGLEELILTATIYWKNGSMDVSKSLSTSLTNWR